MAIQFFENTFKNAQMPVIVCRNTADYPVVFMNVSAQLLLSPNLTVSRLENEQRDLGLLRHLLRFQAEGALDDILGTAALAGSVGNYPATVYNFEGRSLALSISANVIALPDGDYVILYLFEQQACQIWTDQDSASIMSHVFQTAYHSADMSAAINSILRIAGTNVHVSRVYIFEEISAEITRNTYEWCNLGVEPAIGQLQNLRRADYDYDTIVNGGVFISNDIRELPEKTFRILDAQGIKSLAIMPMYYADIPLGYVGFDDCQDYRRWSSLEIELLKNVAEVLVSLIVRRNAEKKATRSLDILQTISDNLDSVIYVNDLYTYEVLFINKALSDSLQRPAEELIGKPCWQVLQKGKTGPCEFCPLLLMVEKDGSVYKENYVWEFQNTVDYKWYLIRDSIIDWVDGRKAHIETANEITPQKQYEQQLQYFASTDTMTGAYNREWGSKLLHEMLSTYKYGREMRSLVFIDLDGLKRINDTYGHDAGDDMIISIVRTLRSATRKSDMLFRWGGDEFILLLECTPANAETIMQGVQHELEVLNSTGSRPYRLSFSYGITEFQCGENMAVDELIAIADKRMYDNKMQKR